MATNSETENGLALPQAQSGQPIKANELSLLDDSRGSTPKFVPTTNITNFGTAAAASTATPKLNNVPQDCMPCKIVGFVGFGGLGMYSFYQAQQLPKNLVARRAGLVGIGAVCLGAGVYRLFMPLPQREESS